MWLDQETLSNIIIGVFNVPFSTYETFNDAQISNYEYYSFTSGASSSYYDSLNNSGTIISHTETSTARTIGTGWLSSYYATLSRSFSASGRTGTSNTQSNPTPISSTISKYTVFSENIGFFVIDNLGTFDRTDSYYFSSNALLGLERQTSEQTEISLNIRSTTETEISSTILEIPTTWTDVTTYAQNTPRTITQTTTTLFYATGIDNNPYTTECNQINERCLFLQPIYGESWTRDGTALEYIHVFTSTGTFGPYNSFIIKDNDSNTYSFPEETETFTGNVAILRNGANNTIISGVTETLSYDQLGITNVTTLTNSGYYSYNAFFNQFTFLSESYYTQRTYNPTTSIATQLTQELASEFSINLSSTIYFTASAQFLTTTKATSIYTTGVYYFIDKYSNYFNSFTYRGLVTTTAESSYFITQLNDIGFSSSSSTIGNTTTNSAFNAGNEYSATYEPVPLRVRRGFYTLPLGGGAGYEAYYTQLVPPYRWVVGGTSDSVGGHKISLSPESLVTKLYFTTYAFERGGILNRPVLAIPIDYTNTSASEGDTAISLTYQSVNVPSGFMLGESSASVYWTTSISGDTTDHVESFEIGYSADQSLFTIGYYNVKDFDSSIAGIMPYSAIYHTQGLVKTSNNASWSFDHSYYWVDSIRTTSGSSTNPVSPDNQQPLTYVGSHWLETNKGLSAQIMYPVTFVTKQYLNSFT